MSELESAVAAARDRLNGLKAGRDSRKRRSKDKGSSDGVGDMFKGRCKMESKKMKVETKVEKLKAHFENVTELTRLRDAK